METPNWLEIEAVRLESNKPHTESYNEPLKLMENKITEIVIDFSAPFAKKPNKLNADNLQALIPVTQAGVKKTFWLNVKNPLYSQLIKHGNNGVSVFKLLRTGSGKDTRYTIVE